MTAREEDILTSANLIKKGVVIDELLKSMQNHLNNQNIKNFEVPTYNLNDEKILVEDIDYYYSNTIARASKTMSECRYARANLQKTGTEG